jgi:dephospho-CoA kinase
MPRTFIVVMTGGIASGKSTVSSLFSALGVPVIDTDDIARDITRPQKPALTEIKREFGPDILFEDGSLDRKQLRKKIFSSPALKAKLEAILHPKIAAIASCKIHEISCPYCILVVPLLVETESNFEADRILVVDAPIELQVKRLIERDSIDKDLACAIIASQANREERLKIADDIIKNSEDFGELKRSVRELHYKYLSLSRKKV